jgi:hypothetical protein
VSTAARSGWTCPSIRRLLTPLDGGVGTKFLSRLSLGTPPN